jgi:hypothetical protein
VNVRIHPLAAIAAVLLAVGVVAFYYWRTDSSGTGQRPAGSMPPAVAAEFGRRMQGGMPTKGGPSNSPSGGATRSR